MELIAGGSKKSVNIYKIITKTFGFYCSGHYLCIVGNGYQLLLAAG